MSKSRRRLSPLQAVSLNMAMMVGVGSFTAIPLLVGELGGPATWVAWALGAALAVADGLVWCELAAAFPGSGGTYHFFDAVYGDAPVGRLLKFLFIWQFLLSGPLEIASGAIGLGQYAGHLFPRLDAAAWSVAPRWSGREAITWTVTHGQILAIALTLGLVALAYRRIEVAGKLMVALWVGMLVTVLWTIVAGLSHASPSLALGPPSPGARSPLALGRALGLAMYCFLGYYQVCYLGDEVAEPSRMLPRSILVSVVAVAAMNVAMNLGVLGVIPWDAMKKTTPVVSLMIDRLQGSRAAALMTLLILWTGGAGLFAALLSYSRIPYAAARAGHFFRFLARTHPTGGFPHYSLILVGLISAVACLVDLSTVIDALLASRILVQFVAQIATIAVVRSRPGVRLPFRMRLYPLPALLALFGWLWVLGTRPPAVLAFGLGSLVVGLVAFVVWERIKGSVEAIGS
ncbi:MAG TPA: APC family permease [Isosphaeraceae bacterium]|jgi:amino acid transporter|nr:APC family permease [Isosphaeraceae bacterium]